jgi:DNA-directed RNA polymerase specialized sigma subunit
MKENEKVNEEIAIHLDNFDTLAKKYRPVILANIKRVHKLYESHARVEFDDLYQEGLIALHDSIKHFNPDRGVFFGLYLKIAIGNKLKCYCRNFLPHYYVKDTENSTPEKPKFKRERVNVSTLDDVKSHLI